MEKNSFLRFCVHAIIEMTTMREDDDDDDCGKVVNVLHCLFTTQLTCCFLRFFLGAKRWWHIYIITIKFLELQQWFLWCGVGKRNFWRETTIIQAYKKQDTQMSTISWYNVFGFYMKCVGCCAVCTYSCL